MRLRISRELRYSVSSHLAKALLILPHGNQQDEFDQDKIVELHPCKN